MISQKTELYYFWIKEGRGFAPLKIMQAKFYKFSKRNNSTKLPSGGINIDFSFKRGGSGDVLNPVIDVTTVNSNYNYVYIPLLSRYYWVRNVEFVSNTVYRYYLSVDVLATYRSGILANESYVLRASAESNNEITDTFFPAVSGTKQKENHAQFIPLANPGFIVAVMGCDENQISNLSGVVNYYLLTDTALANLIKFIFNKSNYADEFTDAVVATFFNPSQYLVSCMYCPFASGGTGDNIKIGWWETGISGKRLSPAAPISIDEISLSIPRQNSNANHFLNQSPFSNYRIYIPFLGMQEISAAMLKGESTVKINGKVDICTGTLMLKLTGGSGKIIATYECTGCVSLPLAQSSMPINYLTAGSAGVSALSDIFGWNQGTFNGAVNDIASGILGASRQVSINGQAGNSAQRQFDSYARIICDYTTLAGTDYNDHGAPLCATRQLSSLSPGYVKCLSPHFENSIANMQEIEMVESYLIGGIYLE